MIDSNAACVGGSQRLRATRAVLAVLIVAAINVGGVSGAFAKFPDRAVKLIVASTAGSAVDVIARLFARYLSEAWEQPVIVDNRGGANGQIAAQALAQSNADGYSMMITTAAALTTSPIFSPEAGKVALKELQPITILVGNDFVIAVRRELNVKSLSEFVDYAKKNPGKLNIATSVSNGTANLLAQMFKKRAGIDYTVVPFNGGGAAVTSILGKHTDAIFESLTLVSPMIESGELVPLASTGSRRSTFVPGLPTLAESGFPGIQVTGWLALLMPIGTPDAIVQKIREDVGHAAKGSELADRINLVKMYTILNTQEEFRNQWQSEIEMWGGLAKEIRDR